MPDDYNFSNKLDMMIAPFAGPRHCLHHGDSNSSKYGMPSHSALRVLQLSPYFQVNSKLGRKRAKEWRAKA